MRRACIGACAVGAAILVVAGWGAWRLSRGGISARPTPSALEVRAARALRHVAIPRAAREAVNPIPAGPKVIAAGLAHFADHCATCHDDDGSGRTVMGGGLYPRAPDMRGADTQGMSDGELFYVIEQGVRFTGMPAWGGPGTAEGSWHLVHFIRHLPRLTQEERVRMEELHPRSPGEWRELEREDAFLRGEGAPAGSRPAN